MNNMMGELMIGESPSPIKFPPGRPLAFCDIIVNWQNKGEESRCGFRFK
jgi:hypothetical protein